MGETTSAVALQSKNTVDFSLQGIRKAPPPHRHRPWPRAGTRRSAQIVVVFSIVVILGLAVFNRSFVAPYNSLTGQLVLLVVMALFTMGLLWMRRLAGVSLPRRFLTARAAPSGEGRS